MKKTCLALCTSVLMLSSVAVEAAPREDLAAALENWKNPEGHYIINMHIHFPVLGELTSDNVLDIQAKPFIIRNQNHTKIGKADSTNTFYEVQEGNRLKSYDMETIGHGTDAKKQWVYKYTPLEGGGNAIDSLHPSVLLDSVKSVTQTANDGATQTLNVVFDSAKLFSNNAVKNNLYSSNTGSDSKTLDKTSVNLEKCGDIPATVTIVHGRITHAVIDITKPVKAFDDVIVNDLSKKQKDGALGSWVVHRLFATGRSTLTFSIGPVVERNITIPQDVLNAAIPIEQLKNNK